MNVYKECNAKSYSFLVTDTTLASNNLSRFRNNLSERIFKLILQLMIRLEMKNYNITLTEKHEKCHHYCRVKLINMNILQVKKYYLLIKIE